MDEVFKAMADYDPSKDENGDGDGGPCSCNSGKPYNKCHGAGRGDGEGEFGDISETDVTSKAVKVSMKKRLGGNKRSGLTQSVAIDGEGVSLPMI